MAEKRCAPSIIPTMRYADAPAAIAWLARAFGFKEQLVVPGPQGTIAHAQLTLGDGMIMLGSARDDALGSKLPKDLGGITQAPYIVVDDPDALYARAIAAGAEGLRPPEDTDYGSRDFSVRDPEGHLWHFGTYRPTMS
jgi:uncharacterized glyoxalase superfamily protein PhnB